MVYVEESEVGLCTFSTSADVAAKRRSQSLSAGSRPALWREAEHFSLVVDNDDINSFFLHLSLSSRSSSFPVFSQTFFCDREISAETQRLRVYTRTHDVEARSSKGDLNVAMAHWGQDYEAATVNISWLCIRIRIIALLN